MKHNNLDYINSVCELARLLREKSYKEGDFTLASGRKSDYYFDCRITSLTAEGSRLIGEIFYDLIEEHAECYGQVVQGVAGMTMGADPLVTATTVASSHGDYHLNGLLIRKQPKDHGTNSQIEGLANFCKGDMVFMLEDVITTGDSVLKAAKVVEAAGLKVAGIIVILDREEGGRANLEAAGYKVQSLFTKETLKRFSEMKFEMPQRSKE